MKRSHGKQQIKRMRLYVSKRYRNAICQAGGGEFRIVYIERGPYGRPEFKQIGSGSSLLGAWKSAREHIRVEEFAAALTA